MDRALDAAVAINPTLKKLSRYRLKKLYRRDQLRLELRDMNNTLQTLRCLARWCLYRPELVAEHVARKLRLANQQLDRVEQTRKLISDNSCSGLVRYE